MNILHAIIIILMAAAIGIMAVHKTRETPSKPTACTHLPTCIENLNRKWAV